jgi:polar amino acid transport system substrate-binding protein
MDRKVLTAVLAVMVMLILSFAGCAEAPSGPADGGVTTYVVGIDAEYPPFSYLDPQGNAIGFDVESMKWIAEDQGFEVKFQPTAWDGIIPALEAKKIDVIYAGMTITPERAEKVAFSNPYWTVNQDVAALESSTVTIEDVLAGNASIGVQRGCTAATWVEENLVETGILPQSDLKVYDNTPLAVTDLVNGRVDVVMYDDLSLDKIIEGKPARIIGSVETKEEFGVAVRKEDTELLAMINDGLANLMADPYWEELQDKYEM